MLVQIRTPRSQGEAEPRPRVTLIRPAIVSSRGAMSDPVVPPLGLGYVAALLVEDGVDVHVIDATIGSDTAQVSVFGSLVLHGLSIEETVARVPEGSEVIGVSCMFSQDWPSARALLAALRARFPAALLVIGGEHATALTEFSLRDCPALDVIVRGEGEETAVELVRIARHPERFGEVAGIAFLRDGQFVQTAPRKRIRDVAKIPRPAWDLFPVEAYTSTDNAFGVNRGRSMGVLATRGCPYDCTFCSNPGMYGRAWVAREPDDVLDEIEDYMRRFRVTNIDFFDLTMVLKRQWILDFCRQIEERGLQFTWQLPSGTRSEVIDEEVARALYRTGCRNIAYAPESGSEETLQIVRKKVHLDRLVTSIGDALRAGIVVRVNLIIGFPHETHRHVWQTLAFAWRLARLGVHDVGIYQFSPYPGTELYDELRAEGKIPALDESYFRSLLNYKSFSVSADYCRGVGPRALSAYRVFGMASFFAVEFASRPERLVALIKSLRSSKANTALETRLAALMKRRYRKGAEGAPAGFAVAAE